MLVSYNFMAKKEQPFQRSKLCDAMLKFAKEQGLEIEKPIVITMRDCNDVPNYLRQLQRAHKNTDNSTLRFGTAAPDYHPENSHPEPQDYNPQPIYSCC